VGLFCATLCSVYLVYGFLWTGGNPLTEADAAGKAASFAGTLMAILLAHEMGHWLVARRHGFALSLPYFIPFPAAFGTFGAVIRLRSLPRSRTALLEMGAAGPLAGFVVSAAAIAISLPETGPAPPLPSVPSVAIEWPAWLGPLDGMLDYAFPPPPPGHAEVLIFANPPLMDLLGTLQLGAPPGRFDELAPMALAGWVGCLLTAMNLLPIGQLDGGHIMAGLWPKQAQRISKLLLGVVLAAGLLWTPWAVWASLLFFFRGYENLEVPQEPKLTKRAWLVLALVVLAFALSFMPVPMEPDFLPVALP
jgi:membrane-associated protease RseP (regulator of RpoE activity)